MPWAPISPDFGIYSHFLEHLLLPCLLRPPSIAHSSVEPSPKLTDELGVSTVLITFDLHFYWCPTRPVTSWRYLLFLSIFVFSSVFHGEGTGNTLQYSCLETPMDGGAWWAAVHGVAESQTRLSDFTLSFHFHALEKEMATHSSVLAWRIPGTGEPGGLPSVGS